MARNVSLAALQGALAQETNEVYLVLMEIDHSSFGSPLRFVNNDADITSNGDLYTAFPFEVVLPDDVEDKEPLASLRITNVSRELIDEIRSIQSPPSMVLSVILESSPDIIEWGPLSLETRGVTYDADYIVFRLAYSAFTREPFPYRTFNTIDFPGLFN